MFAKNTSSRRVIGAFRFDLIRFDFDSIRFGLIRFDFDSIRFAFDSIRFDSIFPPTSRRREAPSLMVSPGDSRGGLGGPPGLKHKEETMWYGTGSSLPCVLCSRGNAGFFCDIFGERRTLLGSPDLVLLSCFTILGSF